MEREIRHKIKKGDLSEIPKDVLDSMTPSLLAPPKGLLKCRYFFKVLSTVYLMMVGRCLGKLNSHKENYPSALCM